MYLDTASTFKSLENLSIEKIQMREVPENALRIQKRISARERTLMPKKTHKNFSVTNSKHNNMFFSPNQAAMSTKISILLLFKLRSYSATMQVTNANIKYANIKFANIKFANIKSEYLHSPIALVSPKYTLRRATSFSMAS